MSRDSARTDGRRANILFIQCDSMDGRAMGAMGHPAMGRATPHLDALAARGRLFANAYSNNPICVPSRSSMFSGVHTHHCEGWNNFKGLEPGTPTFLSRLDAAGYAAATFGKTDYLSGFHTIRARVTAWTRAACILRPGYIIGPPRVAEGDPERLHERDWADVDRSIEWLSAAAERPATPFMLYLGIRAPHPAFHASQRYVDMVEEAGVELPPPDGQDHPAMAYMRASKNWTAGFDPPVVRAVRRTYFAMIAEVDAMVGRVLAAVERLRLAEATYVIFASDHGEMALEHRQVYKQSLYEPSVRVPLIVAGPGVAAGGREQRPVSLVDIYPTLMDMAARPQPAGLDGHSLLADPAARPEAVLSQCHDSSCCTGTFMLRRGRWKLIHYVGLEPQLFDLERDPWEVRNLAAAEPAIAAEMDRRLHEAVDCEAVDAKVKAYDRRCFRRWRDEQRAAGRYEPLMARIYSGWDGVQGEQVQPWTADDEAQIDRWLAEGGRDS